MAAITTTTVSAAGADSFESVRQFIREKLVERGAPSIAVAVVDHGKIIWEEGFGWADREKRLASDAHTMYSLASISKPITATGIMILQDRRRIDLDKPINDYLGDAKVAAKMGDVRRATVRRVLDHTAGLPLHYQFYPVDSEFKRPPMEETIRRYANLLTPPGEDYQYSNLGYGILDHVISRLSGLTYPEFMRREVFVPLGMNRSSVDIGPGLEPYCAARYTPGGQRLPFYDFDHPGGSAVYSSAHDLARFALFHLKSTAPDQKPVLTSASVDEMQQPARPDLGYGLGWALGKLGEHFTVGHDGGMPGVSTTLIMIPDRKIAVIALCNTSSSLPQEVAEKVLNILLPGGENSRAESRRREPPGPPPPFKPTAELLGEWNGSVQTYAGRLPVRIRFKDSGDVHVRFGEQLWTLVNDPTINGSLFTGNCLGDLNTEEVNRSPYTLRLRLRIGQNTLQGAAIALSRPGALFPRALTHWIHLKR